jgi:hypothetical protein
MVDILRYIIILTTWPRNYSSVGSYKDADLQWPGFKPEVSPFIVFLLWFLGNCNEFIFYSMSAIYD